MTGINFAQIRSSIGGAMKRKPAVFCSRKEIREQGEIRIAFKIGGRLEFNFGENHIGDFFFVDSRIAS